MARLGKRVKGHTPEPSTPIKETLAMIAAASPVAPQPEPPRQFPVSGKSPNTKRRTKKKRKKKAETPDIEVTSTNQSYFGESDAASAGSSVGRLSGVSAQSRRSGKDNPVLNNLLMQIERLEIQNVGSKLKEHKSRSVLLEEKRKHEGALTEAEDKLRESQGEVEALKVGRGAIS
jgi:hypothetical protein